MGDVAQILLGNKAATKATSEEQQFQNAIGNKDPTATGATNDAAKKLLGLVDAHLPPSVPAMMSTGTAARGAKSAANVVVKVGNKYISSKKNARNWIWAPFSNSARNDGLLLHHWVRANVEYPDYPFSRFAIYMDHNTISFASDEEYKRVNAAILSDQQQQQSLLDANSTHNNTKKKAATLPAAKKNELADVAGTINKFIYKYWNKTDTDQLFVFAKQYDLRWSIIYDRWCEYYGYANTDTNSKNTTSSTSNNIHHSYKIEDLQYRFYSITAKLLQTRISQEATIEAHALTQQTVANANAAAAVTSAAVTASAAAAANKSTPTTESNPSSITAAVGSSAATTALDPEEIKRTNDALVIETAAARALASSAPSVQPYIGDVGTGTANKLTFDVCQEHRRRARLEHLWNRTKAEEQEELALRKELKQIDTQLRQLKKSGVHTQAATAALTGTGAAGSANRRHRKDGSGGGNHALSTISAAASAHRSSNINNAGSASSAIVDPAEISSLAEKALVSLTPIPVPGTPYLQSARMAPLPVNGNTGAGVNDPSSVASAASGNIINKSMRARLDAVLTELKVPKLSTATKRVCDLYDTVRRDALTLLVLEKATLEREGILASKRLKVSKRNGSLLGSSSASGGGIVNNPTLSKSVRVVDEETLLGISSSTLSTSAASSSTMAPTSSSLATGTTGRSSIGKGKGSNSGGKGKDKGSSGDTTVTTTTASTPKSGKGTKKASTTKRKRKSAVGTAATFAAVDGATTSTVAATSVPSKFTNVVVPTTLAGADTGKKKKNLVVSASTKHLK